jgi:glyoxylase-like metal-dependent hydrolase (beta-lactamase superfamily II)
MKVNTLVLGDMQNCAYVVENGGGALIIDPSWDMGAIYNLLAANNLTPGAVIFTHGHFDHNANAAELLTKYNLKAYIEESDAALSGLPPELLQTFKGDFALTAAGMDIKILHTPGHTPGSVCVMIEGVIFTGDTLFAGAIGRTDFPGGDIKQMRQSLTRLAKLPAQTKVYAGHTYGEGGEADTTIGQEVKTNPYVKLALEGKLDSIS